MLVNDYVVVGGGTAGWLSACLLASATSEQAAKTVTLIESPDIPIIGVGEGTVPSIRDTLKRVGISESDIFNHCDGSFKQSIKFVNWMDKKKHGENNFYHHLFDYPFPFGDNLCQYWHNQSTSSFAEIVSIQQYLAESMKAPKGICDPEFAGVSDYAYHFDAHKFAQLLKRHAIEKLGVIYVSDTVVDVTHSHDGSIDQLVLKEQGSMGFDFYIDCSGFSSYLLGGKLDVPFVDKQDVIFSNKALTVQVPELEASIPPYTISTAHQAGWIWDIALSNRRGVGFVYCDAYLDKDTAFHKLQTYVGRDLNDFNVRDLDMKIGFRERAWEKNCIAIGLSQGFVEPLEATAILLSDFSANLFCNKLPETTADIAVLSKRFNQRVSYAWQSVIDFVKLHYCISDRQDSEFWQDNRASNSIPDSLKERLELWSQTYPTKDDFFSKFEVFDIENYLYVLCGMNFDFNRYGLTEKKTKEFAAQHQQVFVTAEQYKRQLLEQRALLEKVKVNNFSKS
ncbi:tryptophan halogenase family protein [Pseudoalteromonas luteoviolacea]|uniref:tryptophan halogenase family protein n=1 Tax=Pseudoalteromonas luteoviolacea TaxID=43657 RepID=UPI001152D253|nr:tryptophan halogenase family protein [Pseudoalteromonas luteoviolacea]TQF70405.1 tryptophan 7-halogenase [Pseudoalteromonas luteoviolacea]